MGQFKTAEQALQADFCSVCCQPNEILVVVSMPAQEGELHYPCCSEQCVQTTLDEIHQFLSDFFEA